MSTAALTGLRDYLTGTLSASNMLWLGTQLAEYAKNMQEAAPKRYTMEEINAMLDEAEADIAAGRTIPDEEAWDELDKELNQKEKYEMAEAV